MDILVFIFLLPVVLLAMYAILAVTIIGGSVAFSLLWEAWLFVKKWKWVFFFGRFI